jgi:pimeloyl-ACP methyl ester carboxylesterase
MPGLLLLLAGCSGLLLRDDGGADSRPAPDGVSVAAADSQSSSGCRIDYRVYTTSAGDSDGIVVLAHGFLRSQDRMQALAHALAARGVTVATLDFCSQTPWNGQHVQNARDMRTVADALHAQRVVYAGFSAGGLAAVLAARADPRAVGAVTLDLVDQQGLGARAAAGLYKPLIALTGEPTACNAMANGRNVYAAARRARVQHIAGAGHCDFEAPTDALCRLVCTDPDGDAPPLRGRIVEDAARAAQALLREEPSPPSASARLAAPG